MKCIECIARENVQLEESLTLERPGIFSELLKALIVSLSYQMYCARLDTSVGHQCLHMQLSPGITFLLTTDLIIILVGRVSHVFQALILVST